MPDEPWWPLEPETPCCPLVPDELWCVPGFGSVPFVDVEV
jgi:hypothetical protein